MKWRPVAVLLCSMAVATSASAQDAGQYAGLFAGVVETLGQGVGDAVTGGPGLFVTATGHADLPAPLADAYTVQIEGRSKSAVEAAQQRDDRLKSARDLAQRMNVALEIGSVTLATEIDQAAAARRFQPKPATPGASNAPPALLLPDQGSEWVFVARSNVRVRAADPRQLPAFLDALKAVGVEILPGPGGLGVTNPFLRNNDAFGLGSVDKVDDSVWDRASQNAITAARHQADVLAKSAGRQLGDVRQILVLARTVQGDKVSVTIAVRFNLR